MGKKESIQTATEQLSSESSTKKTRKQYVSPMLTIKSALLLILILAICFGYVAPSVVGVFALLCSVANLLYGSYYKEKVSYYTALINSVISILYFSAS